MTPTTMNIYIDETLAWQGPLSADALKWDDRVGIRSDNARVQFDLTAPIVERPSSENCRSEPADVE
jgi:hypothetical protein